MVGLLQGPNCVSRSQLSYYIRISVRLDCGLLGWSGSEQKGRQLAQNWVPPGGRPSRSPIDSAAPVTVTTRSRRSFQILFKYCDADAGFA